MNTAVPLLTRNKIQQEDTITGAQKTKTDNAHRQKATTNCTHHYLGSEQN